MMTLVASALAGGNCIDDEGLTVQVWVNFTDDAGNPEAMASAATGAVSPREPETPQEPPPAPQNLTATVNDDGSVTLTWNAPDDDSVTSYQILRRRPREGENALSILVSDTGSTATTYTDTDVTSGVKCVYRVKAINTAGVGEKSRKVTVTP
jgi:titin